jgi:transcription initiation factor TFIIH subunit 3
VFANAHLMQSSNNEIAIMACHGHSAKFLYPCENTAEIRQIDGQYEKFTMTELTVRQQLQQVINEIAVDPKAESLISGALSMALCYIARLERDKVAGQKLHSRILVITGSNDSAKQYMNYMNIFFTAQRMVCCYCF